MALVVDTHAHIYAADEVAYPPIEKPYRPPAGSGTPERLREVSRAVGVDKVMMVQTTTFYGWDNRYVRDTGRTAGEWASVVCTLDPEYPHSADVLDALVQRSRVKALRTYAAPQADGTRRYDTRGNRTLLAAARELGIVVNALLSVPQADGLARLAQEFSDLPIVIDHCLALAAGANYEATVAAMVDLARYPNLRAKLSYLPTGSAEEYPFRDMQASCRQFIEAYGPERCIWGSDFPTELWCPKTTYEGHLELFRSGLGLSDGERDAILGETAARLYGL